MSAYNAQNVKISVMHGSPTPTEKVVARQTDCTFDETAADIDITSKTSSAYGESLPGNLTGEISFSAFFETTPAAGEVSGAEIRALFRARTTSKWIVAGTISGTERDEVFCYISKLTRKYANNTGAQYDVTLKVTGAPTTTVVA